MGIKMGGVPIGSRWANMLLYFLNQPKIKNLIQMLKAIGRLNDAWEVTVKLYGRREIVFIIMIMRKIEDIILTDELFFFSNTGLISFSKKFFTDRTTNSILLVFDILICKKKTGINIISQFIFKHLVDGSKIENKFVIIFILVA
jgi:hypothetical protein